jgi:diaminopimelate decarboxylase
MLMEKLWPLAARADESGELWLGGCPVSALVAAHGTPLYVFDESTLRTRVRGYRDALRQLYPGTAQIAYASKAYLSIAIAQLFEEEGLDLDVVSGGELYVALQAGFPPARIHFHGNNKTPEELAQALAAGVGRMVVDNFHELGTLAGMASGRVDHPVHIWLRLSPGIQPHTHSHIQTGQEDTKFGFSIANGDAERAASQALQTPGLSLMGLHCHIGSQIYEPEALADAAWRLVEFAATIRERCGVILAELSPGGGWGVPMVESDPPAPLLPYVAAVTGAVVSACRSAGFPRPHLVLEPGRSLVAAAGVAIYRVGARKEIPGVRTYVSVDGGMADNIRPALYGARYTALVMKQREAPQSTPSPRAQPRPSEPDSHAAQRTDDRNRPTEVVTIAGKFCESGDILIQDIELPRANPGDLLAIPMAGAYTLSMASNYNLACRPAVVLARDGTARLIQRRETFADLLARDLSIKAGPEPAAARGDGVDRAGSPNPLIPAPRSRSILPLKRTFRKYQALGNDYIVLDPAEWPGLPGVATVRRICDRHLGIGSDGLLWGPVADEEPFRVRRFNPDGEEFEKSGNGVRIFARYLWDRGLAPGPHFILITLGGPVTAHVLDAEGSRIAVEMGRLSFDSRVIPVAGPPREVIEEAISLQGHKLRVTAATIGNPHCVVFREGEISDAFGDFGSLEDLARRLGPLLEHLHLYPHRTNVQFAQVLDRHTLQIEIWERGAGYTLSSGTSSCAAAGAAVRTGRCDSPVMVQMPGGAMLVEIASDWSVRLTGTVAPVCHGELTLQT